MASVIMKTKTFIAVFLVAFILVSCVPAAKVVPTETIIPTSIFTPAQTATIIPTPIPMINVEGQNIPDPRFSNPDFFDISNANSPIVQFANVFGVKLEDVISGLHAEIVTPMNGIQPFAVMRTSDGVTLMMAQQDIQTKEWKWQEATLGNYLRAEGKGGGVYLNSAEFNNPDNQVLVRKYFSNGILAREGDTPTDSIHPKAIALAQEASEINASSFFHYVVEPGKFPSGVDTSNVDAWLSTRLDDIVNQLLKNNLTSGRPMYISFNEPFGETSGWNPESNPLRDKYGNDNWMGEYVYQLMTKLVDAGLVPNQDFVIVFNDGRLYNRPDKQDFAYNNLIKARQDAFAKLIANPSLQQKLSQMGINKPEDLQILLGTETHTQLGKNEDDTTFWPAPTDEQLTQLTEKFAPLGGVIMTEVNPFGTNQQRQVFLKRMSALLGKLPYFKGMIFWNVFQDPDDGNPAYPLSGDRLILFDDQGNPTSLYYELLR